MIFVSIATIVIVNISVSVDVITSVIFVRIGRAFPTIPKQMFAARVDMMVRLSDSAVDTRAMPSRRSLPRGINCEREPRDNP